MSPSRRKPFPSWQNQVLLLLLLLLLLLVLVVLVADYNLGASGIGVLEK
jgi:hypothetical protein